MQTEKLNLSYLVPEQAQKHVTVNESLSRLDLLVQMQVKENNKNSAPSSPAEGDGYIVGSSPTGDWAQQEGKLAFYQDKKWVFLTPKTGWRVWNNSDATLYVLHAGEWQSVSSSGGVTNQNDSNSAVGLDFHTEEIDHIITAGRYNDTELIIPGKSTVLAITGRVLTTLAGSCTWKLGVAGGDDRYGNQIGYQENSTVVGVSSSPVTYYADTPVKLTAVFGQFSTGKIRLKLYAMKFALPEVDPD